MDHNRKGVSVLLYVINQANKKENSTMCVYRMAKAFQVRRMLKAGPHTPQCHGAWLWMLLPPASSSPHRCPRPEMHMQL